MHTTGLGATDLQDRLPPVFPLDPLSSTIAGNGWSPVRQTGLPGPLRTGLHNLRVKPPLAWPGAAHGQEVRCHVHFPGKWMAFRDTP